MLSIIICSRTKQIAQDFQENIKNTIDSEYELLVIDNSQNEYSIFEAYNLGIKKSTGTYLCFIHDDIVFHTPGWGKVIESIFKSDEKTGLIGIAGATVKTKMPSAWWDCPLENRIINIRQHLTSGEIENWYVGWKDKAVEEVVAIDGVFMAMRKADAFLFNEKLGGFHNYDLDLSFNVKRNNKKIVVTNQFLVEHLSEGQLSGDWVQSTLKIHRLYNRILPLGVSKMQKEEQKVLEIENAKKIIYLSFRYKRSFLALRVWLKLFLIAPKNKYHTVFWKEFLNLT